MDKSCAKELVDCPGYWIYPNGRLWSDKSQKFLKESEGGYRGKYRKYMLYVNEKQKMKYVHRLLMQYFGPPAPIKPAAPIVPALFCKPTGSSFCDESGCLSLS